MNTTIDDIEMLSSSPSSTSSLKEAIKQKQYNNSLGRQQAAMLQQQQQQPGYLTVNSASGPAIDMTVSSMSGHTTTSSVVSTTSGSSPSSISGGKSSGQPVYRRRSNSNEIELTETKISHHNMEDDVDENDVNNNDNEDENAEEPSKLSLSEKMKLFSNRSAAAAGLRPKHAGNVMNGSSTAPPSNHKFSRFQTQVKRKASFSSSRKMIILLKASKFLCGALKTC